jgi:hypothetical protein
VLGEITAAATAAIGDIAPSATTSAWHRPGGRRGRLLLARLASLCLTRAIAILERHLFIHFREAGACINLFGITPRLKYADQLLVNRNGRPLRFVISGGTHELCQLQARLHVSHVTGSLVVLARFRVIVAARQIPARLDVAFHTGHVEHREPSRFHLIVVWVLHCNASTPHAGHDLTLLACLLALIGVVAWTRWGRNVIRMYNIGKRNE